MVHGDDKSKASRPRVVKPRLPFRQQKHFFQIITFLPHRLQKICQIQILYVNSVTLGINNYIYNQEICIHAGTDDKNDPKQIKTSEDCLRFRCRITFVVSLKLSSIANTL